MEMRGVQKLCSITKTASYLGVFEDRSVKNEFLTHINN